MGREGPTRPDRRRPMEHHHDEELDGDPREVEDLVAQDPLSSTLGPGTEGEGKVWTRRPTRQSRGGEVRPVGGVTLGRTRVVSGRRGAGCGS